MADDPVVVTAPSPLAWARRGIAAAALVLGAALLATAWSSYRGVRDAAQDVARAEGVAMLETVRRGLADLDGAPTAADLAALLDAQRDAGLRYVMVRGRDREVVDAGTQLRPIQLDVRGAPMLTVVVEGDRIVVASPLPPRRRRDRVDGGGPRGPQLLMLELEPRGAEALAARARRVVVINAAVAVALAIAAGLAAAWLRRREVVDRAAARQRHLADLGEMSAVLAHEIRNPLASLKGHAQLLVEALPEDGKPRRKAELVVAEALRVEALTTDLLDFVKTGAVRRRRVEPAVVLRAAADEVEPGRVTITADAAAATWSIDPERCQQVLSNLIRNAVQASPAGGAIEATVGVERGRLIFTVRDHGPGIPAGDEERIFAPFHTTRLRGTGLGLAVARRIVEQHGGVIAAGNAPGGGARFTVAIPPGPRGAGAGEED